MKLIILQGIPGSGKSTWARNFVKDKTDWVIVNRDSIRNMRGDYWIPNQERWVTEVEFYSITSALLRNLNVIVDATNMNKKTVDKLKSTVNSINKTKSLTAEEFVNIEYKVFKIDVEEAIERDKLRDRTVGAMVIRSMYNKYKDSYDI